MESVWVQCSAAHQVANSVPARKVSARQAMSSGMIGRAIKRVCV